MRWYWLTVAIVWLTLAITHDSVFYGFLSGMIFGGELRRWLENIFYEVYDDTDKSETN